MGTSNLKILILSDGWPPQSKGGAETIAHGLAGAYAASGHQVQVVTTVRQVSKTNDGCEDEDGLAIVPIVSDYPKLLRPYLGLRNPAPSAAVAAAVRRFEPDVVHAHNVHRYLSYDALRRCRQAGAPVLLTLHDAMSVDYGRFTQGVRPEYRPGQAMDYRVRLLPTLCRYHVQYFPLRNAFIRRYLHTCTDARYTVSAALAEFLGTNGVRVDGHVHTGTDPDRFNTAEGPAVGLRERMGLGGRSLIALSGRLTEEKGSLAALHMLEGIRKGGHDAVLVALGGSPGDCPAFDTLHQQLGLSEAVAYTGWLTDAALVEACQACDLFLVPSICLDAFPTVVLEAMACARPVIATCFGGASEAVQDGVTGYIANPYDTHRWVEHASALLSDGNLARQMGERGRERVRREFSMARCASRYLDLLEELTLDPGRNHTMGQRPESAQQDRPNDAA